MSVFQDHSVLLVVDMVHDFVDPGRALSVPDARGIVTFIGELAAEARKNGVPVIYVNDSHDPDDREFEKWPPHSVVGTYGAQVVDEIAPMQKDYVLGKKRYSAFFETELDQLLVKLAANHIVITGTITNYCVYATALDATMRGYRVTVPEKGVAALSEEDQKIALKQIKQVLDAEVV